jgi:hypothetical protein
MNPSRQTRNISVRWLGALLLFACGADDAGPGGGGGGQGGAPATGGAGAGGLCGATPVSGALEDVSGTWAMLEVAARLAQAPAVPDPIPNAAVTLYRVSQEQDGVSIQARVEACDHWVSDPDALVNTLIPDAYLRALPPLELTGSYAIGADGAGTYQLDRWTVVVGADLSNPEGDALPEAPSDPAVVDADQDGRPGVTVLVTGIVSGELHVVSRRISTAEARPVAADRLFGVLSFTAEENILASVPSTIKDLGPNIVADPVACNSTVELVRLSEDAGCAEILERYEALFPGAVPRPGR